MTYAEFHLRRKIGRNSWKHSNKQLKAFPKDRNWAGGSAMLDEYPRPVSPKPGETRTGTLGDNLAGKAQATPASLNAAQGQRLLLLRFRWLGRAAFQFDYYQIKSGVAGVLRQVGSARGVLCVACLEGKTFLFPVWIAELPLGVAEEHRNRGRMAVHDRLLMRAVVHLQNPYLVVFADYRVMLGINLGRVLGREDGGETEAQRHPIKR